MDLFTPQIDAIAAYYLAVLRSGDRAAALTLIRKALAQGIPLVDLYQGVLQPALYTIGQLWDAGQIDVADEHMVTAITRSVIEQCASFIKPAASGPPRIIAACVGTELHDLGLHMVADCLEIHGWHTIYLGANMPLDALVAMAVRQHIAVVAVSITIGCHARYVRELISDLRQSAIGATVKILVGGQPFQRIPTLWQQIEADGTAPDAAGAVAWVCANVPR